MEDSIKNAMIEKIKAKPDFLKQKFREHLEGFTEDEQGYMYYCLNHLVAKDAHKIGDMIDDVNRKYPFLRDRLIAAWQYHCPSYSNLEMSDVLLKRVVETIRSTTVDFPIEDKLQLISLISFIIPSYNYDEVMTVALYRDDTDTFASLTMSDEIKRSMFAPFQTAVLAILQKDFTIQDIRTINDTLKLIYAPYKKGKTAGIELLEYFFPNVVLYSNDKGIFVDPSDEYSDSPADTWEIGESTDTRMQVVGDIQFSEQGIDNEDLKRALRVARQQVTTLSESEFFNVPFEKLASIREELRAPLSQVAFVESGTANFFTVMEYEGKLFALYQNAQEENLIYGQSLGKNRNETHTFEYVIDPEETYKIKPFQR